MVIMRTMMMTMSMVTRKNWSDDLGLAIHPSSPYLRLQTFRPTVIPIRRTNTNHDEGHNDDDDEDDDDNDSSHPHKQHQQS